MRGSSSELDERDKVKFDQRILAESPCLKTDHPRHLCRGWPPPFSLVCFYAVLVATIVRRLQACFSAIILPCFCKPSHCEAAAGATAPHHLAIYCLPKRAHLFDLSSVRGMTRRLPTKFVLPQATGLLSQFLAVAQIYPLREIA